VGSLPCAKGPVPVKLTIEDWNFLEYPRISLAERPAFLPALMPHVDVLGHLCYFAPGAVTLDCCCRPKTEPEVKVLPM